MTEKFSWYKAALRRKKIAEAKASRKDVEIIGRARMNRDDLFYAIEEEASYQKLIDVLRAVVELHKPEPMPLPDEAEDDVCSFCWHSGARWFYPCPTIEAIEEELG